MLASPSQTPETGPPTPKITRGHSCVLCQQRKVKCDRNKPCSNCIKARAECIPSAPTVPRRRRRKFSEQDLATRLKKYERLLRKHGVKVEEDDDEQDSNDQPHPVSRGLDIEVPRHHRAEKGMLFTDKGNSRYVENTLWENLRDEIEDHKEALQGSSDDEINDTIYPHPENFLMMAVIKDLTSMHPPPVQIFRLWQTFLVNVNPLVKIFHAPTVQQTILDASGDLPNVPKHVEALMFSIYLLAVTSLHTEECESMFGENRNTLLTKYSHATQQALVNARFMKSLNLTTLQAYGLFLLAGRKCYDPHSFWVLTGVSVRIAQRLGIHRDGQSHKLSTFDAEMRRRVWWQIVFLDAQASKLAGAGFPAWLAKFDTVLPLNVSDSDLSPGMKEPPTEKEGITEMLFCCLRYEVAEAVRRSGIFSQGGDAWHIAKGEILIAQKDKAIDELEARFQEKYIRYCDPSIPLHLLAIYLSRSVICTMRLMAHHPRQYSDKGANMPQKEKDMIFGESLKELEISALGHSTKAVQGFLWHIHVHFQLDAFIYVLSELRHRTSGEQVSKAWKQVEMAFEQRPEMLNEVKNSLYFAMGNLTLKAWAKREEAGCLYQVTPPRFISVLRSQRRLANPAPPTPSTDYRPAEDVFIKTSRMIEAAQTNNLEYSTNAYPNIVYDSLQTPPAQWGNMDFDMNTGMPDQITSVDWEYYQTLLDGDLPEYYDVPQPGNTGQSWAG